MVVGLCVALFLAFFLFSNSKRFYTFQVEMGVGLCVAPFLAFFLIPNSKFVLHLVVCFGLYGDFSSNPKI